MYEIKQIPEDFKVFEEARIEDMGHGRFAYITVTKKNRNTIDVAKQLAKGLNLREKEIGYSGNKDKHAVTEQLMSFPSKRVALLKGVRIENVKLSEVVGYGNNPISLGLHESNRFEIVVRNLDKSSYDPATDVVNYFDEQRFGTNNIEIGKNIIKKKFSDAIAVINHPRCEEHLKNKPNDFVGALKQLPMRLLKLYVHSYQSYMWNETAGGLMLRGNIGKRVPYSKGVFVFSDYSHHIDVPLIGFATSLEGMNDDLVQIIEKIMESEKINFTDFVVKEIPRLSLEGGDRALFSEIRNFHVSEFQEDELNHGMKKVTLSFSLLKGAYATIVVKRMFG